MDIIKALAILQYLTNKLLTLADIGTALDITRGAVSNRISRGGSLKFEEIKQLEGYFGISFEEISITTNTLKKVDKHIYVKKNFPLFYYRLKEIQVKNNLLDKEMAKLLDISEKDYLKICTGDGIPTLGTLNKIKENFDVDIDWLLYDKKINNNKTQQNSDQSIDCSMLKALTPEKLQKLSKLLDEL